MSAPADLLAPWLGPVVILWHVDSAPMPPGVLPQMIPSIFLDIAFTEGAYLQKLVMLTLQPIVHHQTLEALRKKIGPDVTLSVLPNFSGSQPMLGVALLEAAQGARLDAHIILIASGAENIGHAIRTMRTRFPRVVLLYNYLLPGDVRQAATVSVDWPSFVTERHKLLTDLQSERLKRRLLLSDVISPGMALFIGHDAEEIASALVGAGIAPVVYVHPRNAVVTAASQRLSQMHRAGYALKLTSHMPVDAAIQCMSPAVLIGKYISDPTLSQYSIIILDDIHLRTLYSDILLSLLRRCAAQRPDLRLVLVSGLEDRRISTFFAIDSTYSVSNVKPVQTEHVTQSPLDCAFHLCTNLERQGNIVLFAADSTELTPFREQLMIRLRGVGMAEGVEVIAIDPQTSVESYRQEELTNIQLERNIGMRKCVIAVNVEDTQRYLENVRYVIDTGYTRQKAYDPVVGVQVNTRVPISKHEAKLRADRAGRQQGGLCYRLYPAELLKEAFITPEVKVSNIRDLIATVKLLGLSNVSSLPLIDTPPPEIVTAATDHLTLMGVLTREGELTPIGRTMMSLPLDYTLGRTLVASVDLGCSDEMATIVSFLATTMSVFSPKVQPVEATVPRFAHPLGDIVVLLAVYNACAANDFSSEWCTANFVSHACLDKVRRTRQTILAAMNQLSLPVVSCGGANTVQIRKALCAGFYRLSAKLTEDGYRTIRGNERTEIHACSVFKVCQYPLPPFVLFSELTPNATKSGPATIRLLTPIEPEWLREMAPDWTKEFMK